MKKTKVFLVVLFVLIIFINTNLWSESESIEQIPNFNSISFVLFSIFFMCVIFLGLQTKKIIPGLYSGIALICFGGLMHFIALMSCVFQGKTPASILIGMFCCFWIYLGISFISLGKSKNLTEENSQKKLILKEIDDVLKFLEPAMIMLIWPMAIIFYKEHVGPRNILLFGLIPILLVLWIPKVFPKRKEFFVKISKIVLVALGVWT